MKRTLALFALPLIAAAPLGGEVALGEAQAFGTDVSVTPNAVIEDSRCPPDVMCIQAGRLVVAATFRNGGTAQAADLELGGTMRVKGGMLTLASATPPAPANTEGDDEAEPTPLRVTYTFAPDTME
ncbi:hypothetical protein [Erythrobacter litoralis]|uniref:hypothetical protein n=1 Tax=Erythrobacter litoralis TaxID=39960 RepID=UPI0024347D92|nr:hypothetical protein [Erythrobacter litoralis]